jgi:hypothetical protein
MAAAFALGWATAGKAQRLGGGGAVDIPVGRIIAAFLLCVLLAWALAVALKHRGGRGGIGRFQRLFARSAPPSRIAVLETRRASVHADVCLIRCDGDDYLILCSPHVQTVLRCAPAPRDAESACRDGTT